MGKDHQLELYSGAEPEDDTIREVSRYLYDDQTWKKDETWWGPALLKEHGLQFDKVVCGMDGSYYLSGFDNDYVYHIYRVAEDGSAAEMIEDALKPQDGERYGMIPRTFAVTPDGNDFVTVLDGAVVRYSLLNGQVAETIPYDGLQSGQDGISAVMFSDGAGGIYVANETGLAHVNKGGTIWENIIDGSLNSMGMRSMNMRAFMAGQSEDYYGFYSGDLGADMHLYHYTYDPNLASAPPITLAVYALHDNSTARQAAALLQKDNPDVRVEFRAALQDDNSSMTEDVVRSLNTELLSGKGADVQKMSTAAVMMTAVTVVPVLLVIGIVKSRAKGRME